MSYIEKAILEQFSNMSLIQNTERTFLKDDSNSLIIIISEKIIDTYSKLFKGISLAIAESELSLILDISRIIDEFQNQKDNTNPESILPDKNLN